jgi:ABC-2 type transport system permease protein
MENKYENYTKALLGLICMVLLIYIGTTLGKGFKLDFTEEGLYTISDGSKKILKKLDSPVKLRLYYSKTAANKGTEGLRVFNNYYNYIVDLLNEYVQNSRNNLSLEIIDPRPDTEEEEDAIAYGLKKFPLTETESYFFGLVAENESGTEKIIEFFDPNLKDKVEYDITKLIYTVLNPQKKSIGILSSLDILNQDLSPYMTQIMRMQGKEVNDSWLITKLLKEFYNVKKIEKETDKITGIDSLIIIHPRGFSDKTLFAIDQYLLKGGKLMVFTDPHVASAPTVGGEMNTSPDIGFKKLMDKWGVSVKENVFAGDKYLSAVGRIRPDSPPVRVLPYVSCDKRCSEGINDTITSGLNKMTFVLPGVLEKKDVDGLTHSTILQTTSKGNEYRAFGYELGSPMQLWQKFQEGDKPVAMGMKIFGKFKTAFPEGIKVTDENTVKKKSKKINKKEAEKPPGVIKESSKDSVIFVFSDVDFINDRFAFKKSFLGQAVANQNSTLLLNAVEALLGDLDLLSVRSKGRINRNFDVILGIEMEAEKKTASKVAQINNSIARFQSELNQLGSQANEGNIALIQNEGLKKKKELAKKIAVLKKELREVKREGREKVESIGKFLMYINTLFVPTLIVLGGVVYFRIRNRNNVIKISENAKNSHQLKEANV